MTKSLSILELKKGLKVTWESFSGTTKYTGIIEDVVDFGHDFKEDLKVRISRIKSFPKRKETRATKYFSVYNYEFYEYKGE